VAWFKFISYDIYQSDYYNQKWYKIEGEKHEEHKYSLRLIIKPFG